MRVPPALTWTCLLKQDPSYLCDSAPGWFLQMLRPRQGQSFSPSRPELAKDPPGEDRPSPNPLPEYRERALGRGRLKSPVSPRIRVSWGRSAPPDQTDVAGEVIVNARPSCRDLHAQGFAYVRQFAVLPNLRRARWFIPLDSGAVASGAFDLYTPARFSARLKQLTARALARLRLPLWYRDHVTIASRELPPVEAAIRGLFPDVQVRLALSAGAPEPARNRKPSLAVLDPEGNLIAIGKLALSPLARQIAENEARVLRALAQMSETKFQAPRLLFAGEVDQNFLVVQSALGGTPGPAYWCEAHERFCQALCCGSSRTAAATEMIHALGIRVSRLAVWADECAAALDAVMPTLEAVEVPRTIVHGDFAPWNLRWRDDSVSAFDWEYAELDGLPLIDQTHFRLQVGYLLNHWTDEYAAAELARIAGTFPLGYTAVEATAFQVVYLIDMLSRLIEEGYEPDDDMLAWYRGVIRRISADAREVARA